MELIAQGAEAKLFRDKNKIIKERISKEYRLAHLDISLRRFRTRREAKILGRLDELSFPAPKLHDFSDKRMTITMDFLEGEKVKDALLKAPEQFEILAKQIGNNIATLHKEDIVHGDLTTSNMLVKNETVSFIDFGLSQFSEKVEDKAVDLFLLDRALESTHFNVHPQIFDRILAQYSQEYSLSKDVLERLEKVQKRGRNKNK